MKGIKECDVYTFQTSDIEHFSTHMNDMLKEGYRVSSTNIYEYEHGTSFTAILVKD